MRPPIKVQLALAGEVPYPAEFQGKMPKKAFAAVACVAFINTPETEIEAYAEKCRIDRSEIGGDRLHLLLSYLPDNVYDKLVALRERRLQAAYVSLAYTSMCNHIEGLSGTERNDFIESVIAKRENLYLTAKSTSQPTQQIPTQLHAQTYQQRTQPIPLQQPVTQQVPYQSRQTYQPQAPHPTQQPGYPTYPDAQQYNWQQQPK